MGQRKSFLSIIDSWLQWNIVTGISLALALALLPAIVYPGLSVLPLPVSLLASAAVCGVLIGLAQAGFLRLQVSSLARWSIASGIGGAAAALLMTALFQSQIALLDGIVGATLAGLVLGSFQSLGLSSPAQRRTWITSTTLGWITASIIAVLFFANQDITPVNAIFEILRSVASGWVLLALVLLFALLVLFPRHEERNFDERITWLP